MSDSDMWNPPTDKEIIFEQMDTIEELENEISKLQAALDVAKTEIKKHHTFWAHEPERIYGCSAECKNLCELLEKIEEILK